MSPPALAAQTSTWGTVTSGLCPEFGWDRVNFHKKPGRDTARKADTNWPNKPCIQHHVTGLNHNRLPSEFQARSLDL